MPFVGTKLFGVDLSRVSTVAEHVLGTRVVGEDGSEFVYVKAGAALSPTDIVSAPDVDGESSPVTAGYAFGVSPVTVPLDSFGWVQVRGPVEAAVAATLAAGAEVSTIAASGALPDRGTGDAVRGVLQTAESGGTATVYLV